LKCSDYLIQLISVPRKKRGKKVIFLAIVRVTSDLLLKGRQAVMWHHVDDKESNFLLSMFGTA
jgi:hypothetical protein